MAAVTFPRRITSTATTITVNAADLSWVPAIGRFASVSLTNATTVDPDPSNVSAYRGNRQPGMRGIWDAYNGGIYAPTLGTYGSMLFFGGGHDAYEGNWVPRYDIETRTWSRFTEPDDTGTTHGYPSASTDSDSVNDRVGVVGQWIKDGFGNAYPNTEVTGASTTNWKPYPIHTNCGITFIPSDAGGGTLGSLVFVGHDQSNIRVIGSTPGKVWRLDLSTKVWSVVDYTFTNDYSPHGCEYDSFNKVLWLMRGNSSPLASYNYSAGTMHYLSGNNINNTSDYPNLCFVPTRNVLVRITGAGTVTVIPVGSYVHGTTTTLTVSTPTVTGSPPSTLWKNDQYGNHALDKLEYCSYDGCLYYIQRGLSTATTLTLFKLTPPGLGQETVGPWVWSSETINVAGGDSRGTFACNGTGREPSWGGRTRYIPALKCMLLSDEPDYPVQAVRSSTWV